jgi:AcrR family transcriptional regulator
MNDVQPSTDRQNPLLDAAFAAFATYGYRRTTMDDIAKLAHISRTALYLHWRNKEDIFRSLAIRYFDEAVRDMADAFARPGQSKEMALLAAFVAKDGKFMETVLTTPHGKELMDAGFAVAGDLASAGQARMAQVLARWLREQGTTEDIGSAAELADIILMAAQGLKTNADTIEAYRKGQAQLARLFARALA